MSKIIALSTLSQLGLIRRILSIRFPKLAYVRTKTLSKMPSLIARKKIHPANTGSFIVRMVNPRALLLIFNYKMYIANRDITARKFKPAIWIKLYY